MNSIGQVRRKTTKHGEVLEGHVSTLLHNFTFQLERLPKSENPNAPTYRAVTWNSAGVQVVIGAAWLKTMKKAGREGEEFLSLTFDDPSFEKPLNLAAFKSANGEWWDITYRRRQDRAA